MLFLQRILRYCRHEVVMKVALINYAALLQAVGGAAQRHIDRSKLVQRQGQWRRTYIANDWPRSDDGRPMAYLMAIRDGRKPSLGIDAFMSAYNTEGELNLGFENYNNRYIHYTAAAQRWWKFVNVPLRGMDSGQADTWITAWLLLGYLAERRAAWFAEFGRSVDFASEPEFDVYVSSVMKQPILNADGEHMLAVSSVAKEHVERAFAVCMNLLRGRRERFSANVPLFGIRCMAHMNEASTMEFVRASIDMRTTIDGVMERVEEEAVRLNNRLQRELRVRWLTKARRERIASTLAGAQLLLACQDRHDRLAVILPDLLPLLGE